MSDSIRVVFASRQQQEATAAAAAAAAAAADAVTEDSMLAGINGTSAATEQRLATVPTPTLPAQQLHPRRIAGAFPTVPLEMVRQLAIEQQAIVQPTAPLQLRNKSTQCRPAPVSRSLQATPVVTDAAAQAAINPDSDLFGDGSSGLLPCPLPLYFPVPAPLPMDPVPVPIFIPVPVPVPIFLLLESPDPQQPPHLALQTPTTAASAQAPLATTAARSAAAAAAAASAASLAAVQRRLGVETAGLVSLARRRPRPTGQQQQQLSLKFSYGLTAWKNWSRAVASAAAGSGDDELMSSTPLPPAEPAELAPTPALADALARFVREVRKPSGEEYAADSVYYLCLGLQGHLAIDRGRDENIFCDPAFAEFASSLDAILDRYAARVTEDGTLVCRIEEQHLWECRQLGCHSADSLLFALFYILTRYVGVHTAQDHATLTMGQFALAPSAAGGAGAVLRFTPRSGYAVGMTYELGELADPTKCPVRLFQVYLAKRPPVIREDEPFYLPTDRTASPDDAVWYHEAAGNGGLPVAELQRWLNRVRCVKEIQEALMQAQLQWPGAALDPSLSAAVAAE